MTNRPPGPVKNGLAFKDNSAKFGAIARDAIEKAIVRGTIRVQRDAQRMTSEHSGPTATNPTAVPSAPGQPPHKRTGTLTRSLDHEFYREEGTKRFIGRMGTNVVYGRHLELGTTRMVARPYLRPAMDMNRKRIVAEIKQAGREIERAK